MNHGFVALRERLGLPGPPRPVAIAVTFLAVTLAWVFFRAESFGGAVRVLEGMAGANGIGRSIAIDAVFRDELTGYLVASVKVAIFLASLPAVFLLPNVHDWLGPHSPAIPPERREPRVVTPGFRPTVQVALSSAALAALALLQLSQVSEFIYFNF